MRDRIKVAAAQVSPVYMNGDATVDKACKTIEEAGRNGAELIVFSETFIPGYPYWRGILPISRWSELMVEYQKNAVKIPSSYTDVLGDAARRAGAYCVIGCTEMDDRIGSETLYNTLLFLDCEGRVMGRHRKLMPTHAERMIWGMGGAEDLRVFESDLGRLGGLVCYEHHMTLLKAAMAAKGEEIHCAVWPGWWIMDKHPGAKKRFKTGPDPEKVCDIAPAVRQYAFENQVFVVSVGGYLPDDSLPEDSRGFNVAAGGSMIVNPAGLLLSGPVLDEERILYATLDADDRRATKAYFDALGHYSRWDVVRLELREEERSPLAKPRPMIDASKLRKAAQKHGIELEKVESLVEELWGP
ncbi:MAG: carbon-nitrogen hydrolase family protein [Thaumarchaeota archaeon]|nr:carbon-nitrogen hydrolase family protein [Nitrososphaerota archaeon]